MLVNQSKPLRLKSASKHKNHFTIQMENQNLKELKEYYQDK